MSEDLWSERAKGREKTGEHIFLAPPPPPFKLLSLALSTCRSEMLEAVETEQLAQTEVCVNEGSVKCMI